MKGKFAFLLFIVLIQACQIPYVNVAIPSDDIKGLWIVTGVDSADVDPARKEMENFYLNRFLYLQEDGTFTSDMSGQYDHGKYDLKDSRQSKIHLKSFQGNAYQYIFTYSPQDGTGYIMQEISVPGTLVKKTIPIKCMVRNYKYAKVGNDPFIAANNTWRIPARQKENDSLLLIRLNNHIEFWKAYLASADAQEISSINFKNFTTCFEFYPNGISLNDVKDWPPQFRTIFYDAHDADRAYSLIRDAIIKVKPASEANAYKLGVEIFTTMQYYLDHPDEEAINK